MYPRQYTMKPITLLHQKDVCAEPTEGLKIWRGQSVIKRLLIGEVLLLFRTQYGVGRANFPPSRFTPVSTGPEVCAIEPVL